MTVFVVKYGKPLFFLKKGVYLYKVNQEKLQVAQKWYHKATVQSALINALPNLVIVVISIVTLFVSLSISKDERTQNQSNFNQQMQRDSILNLAKDSITKRQMELANFQLKILQEEYVLDKKKKTESDMKNSTNLSIEGVSFLTYETKYQGGYLDSVYGFPPDIIYKEDDKNTISKNFQLLFRLTFYNFKSDSEILNLPLLQTLAEAQEYKNSHYIPKDFFLAKDFTVLCKIKNLTEFPITLNSNGKSHLSFPNSSYKISLSNFGSGNNNLILYPEHSASLMMQMTSSVDVVLINHLLQI